MVIWTEPAKADLRSIHDFIAPDSRYYAKKVTEDIVAKTGILDRLPRIGRKSVGTRRQQHPRTTSILLPRHL